MNKKTVILLLLAFALILNGTAFEAYAFDRGKEKEGHWDLEEKFFYKASLILKNKDELGLSDKQVKEVKDLKIATKKDSIQKKAEIEIIDLDIKSAMYGEGINTAAVGKLIDKKYDLEKEKTKSLVEAYAAIKEILTDQQKAKLKDLWKKCKKETKHDSTMMKDKMKHPMMYDKR